MTGTSLALVRANRAQESERREREAAQRAQSTAENAERRTAAINSYLLKEVFRSPDPWADGKDVRVAEVLDRSARNVGSAFPDDPDLRAAIQYAIGSSFLSLDMPEPAAPLLDAALQTRVQLHRQIDQDVFETEAGLVKADYLRGRFAEVIPRIRGLIERARQALPPDDPRLAEWEADLAAALFSTGSYDEAAKIFERVITWRSSKLGLNHEMTLRATSALADTLAAMGKWNEARAAANTALSGFRTSFGDRHPGTATCLLTLAKIERDEHSSEESVRLFEQAIAQLQRVFGDEHPMACAARLEFCNLLMDRNEPQRALVVATEAYETYLKRRGADYEGTLTAQHNRAQALSRMGKREEALKLHEDTLQRRLRVFGPDHAAIAESHGAMATLLGRLNRFDEAAPLFADALRINLAAFGESSIPVVELQSNLAFALRRVGKLAEAEMHQRACVAGSRKAFPPSNRLFIRDLEVLGEILIDLGRPLEAEAYVREAHELRRAHSVAGDFRRWMSNLLIARALYSSGRFADADHWMGQAAAAPPPDAEFRDRADRALIDEYARFFAIRAAFAPDPATLTSARMWIVAREIAGPRP